MTMQKFSNENAIKIKERMISPPHVFFIGKDKIKQQMDNIVLEINNSKYNVAFNKIIKTQYGYKIRFFKHTNNLIKYLIQHIEDMDFDIHDANLMIQQYEFSFYATESIFLDIINCALDVFHCYLKLKAYNISFIECDELPADDEKSTFVRVVKGPFDIDCLQYKPVHIFQPNDRIQVGTGNESVTWSDHGVLEIYERFSMINNFLFIFIIIDKNLPLLSEFFYSI